jgi:hypothetical protein
MLSSDSLARRHVLKGAVAAAALALAPAGMSRAMSDGGKTVRIGLIGMGRRGRALLPILPTLEGVAVPAVCDIDVAAAERSQEILAKAGHDKAELYTRGEEDYKRMIDRGDLDAVIIATPWRWHTPMAVYGMKAGKYVGVEVPCAITLEQCWELVKTHEATGVPCMMMENVSFRRENLAVLNMIRKGLFGEIVHCHCAHSHNVIVSGFYFDSHGKPRWPADHLLARNAVYLEGISPLEQWQPFPPYQTKYEHSLWKNPATNAAGNRGTNGAEVAPLVGHGGIDSLELREFVRAVRAKTQTPLDIYDSVTMSMIVPLSEQSIAAGSAPVTCPDFTGGRWQTTKPKFAVDS